MNIYVIRHGETDWNKKGIMLTLEDLPLNENGIKQANRAKEIVDNLDYDLVISSPLKRTMQTATIINEKNNKEIIVDKRIIERNAGSLSGKSVSDEIFKNYWNVEKNTKYHGVETLQELFERVYSFLEDIKEEYAGKNILIVTHNGVCRTIKTYFEGIPKDKDIRVLGQGNCEMKMYKI